MSTQGRPKGEFRSAQHEGSPVSTPASASGTKPLFVAERISRHFGGVKALADLSFELFAGEVLGMIGPNGAGKSTTFNVISGHMKPSGGRTWFRGEDVTGLPATRISRRGLGRTFQHDSLMRSMNVYDNILVGTLHSIRDPASRRRRVLETAELLGLDAALDQVAGTLPHGRQRMLSIAIAFASRPLLLGLDEPLTGLNSTESEFALQMIRRIQREFGTSIILVDHNMRSVMGISNRIVVLNHGRLLATGTPAEIRANPEVIKAYLGHDA
jgi:branched-chain amino acid transport system ATP-binding protein